MSNVYHSLASGSLTQNWTDTSLISADDNWAGVPSIIGYRGDDITAGTGVDPQTLLTDATLVVDVNANQTAPNTFSTGGVTEFEIANPTVALAGSGTADAPSIVLHLDSTGRENVTVAFNARDLDGSADNASQQIAVQYRVGDTGAWTNLPAGYIADATTGPSLATLVTPVSVTLPAAANNQPKVQVRIISSNAASNDEWVGIDDIVVSSAPVVTNTTTVSISDASIVEGDSGTSLATFTLTRSDNATAFSVDVTARDDDPLVSGSANGEAGDFNYGFGTVSFDRGGPLTQMFTVTIIGDAVVEPNETFRVTLSNATNGVTIADGTGVGTILTDDFVITRIHDIQGSGATTSLTGQTVTVEAIVVGDFQDGDADAKRNLNGFFLQEADANADASAATSEGIFVSMSSLAIATNNVAIGDKVRVTGVVGEAFGQTQVTATSLSVISSGNTLPTAATITLPAAAVVGGQPDLEAFEGMRVTIASELTITEQFNLDRFGEIKLAAGGRPAQFTHENAPDAAGYAAHLADLASRTITYDDGLNVSNAPIGNLDGFGPTYTTANAPRMGDTITNLSGVLDFGFSAWRVRSAADGTNTFVDSVDTRDALPADVGGRLKVGSFNVLNYFTTIDNNSNLTANGQEPRGANDLTEFNRQTAKLVNVLAAMDADVLGLVELENNFTNDAAGNALDYLVDQLNAKVGAGTYAWIDPAQSFVGGDAISVGYLYKPAKVSVAPGTTIQILSDADLPALGLSSLLTQSSVGGVFDGINTSRNVLAVTWQEVATGEQFTTAANHFKSKSGTGTGADADANDGAGNWNSQRVLAATALSAWLDTDPTGTTDDDYLLLGDFNAYFKEDPISYLIAQGYINLQELLLADPYSFVFDGQIGALDYIFANGSVLGEITGITEWHINSDEADALDYNTDFSRDQAIFDANALVRVSDHDPLLIGLDLSDLVPPAFDGSVASGEVDQDSALILAKVGVTGPVSVQLYTDAAFTALAGSGSGTVTDVTLPQKWAFEGLSANTAYYYRVTDANGATETGKFSTPAALAQGKQGLTFGVSGDWRGELSPYPAVSNADDEPLDFFVLLGDTIYADYPSPAVPASQATTLAEYRAKHAEVYAEKAGLNALGDLRASTAVIVTIDDHEVINDFAGGAPASTDARFGTTTGLINETDLYRNGLQAFTEYNPIQAQTYAGTGDATFDGKPKLYREIGFGKDAVAITLDARSFRDTELNGVTNLTDPTEITNFLVQAFDPTRSMLGDTQFQDLKDALLQAQVDGRTWKFVFVPEPIQNLGVLGAEDRFEGYAAERTALLKFINDNDIKNVVFIAADIHGTVTNNLTYQEFPGGPQIATTAWEITTGSVAFDAPFGQTVFALASAAGLIPAQNQAFYNTLPIAPDTDSFFNDKDDFIEAVVNEQVTALGYDPVGLDSNLSQANGKIDATLISGDYLITHNFGWTKFDIDAATQQLRVTTYGTPAYTVSDAAADPAAVAAQTVSVLGEFTVNPQAPPAPGLTVTPSGGTTAVTEGGANDTLTVVLNSLPAADVTVTLSPGGQTDLGNGPGKPLTLTFTSTTGKTPQTVTVTAVDDRFVEGTHLGNIQIAVSSTDPDYSFIHPTQTVTITDNDPIGGNPMAISPIIYSGTATPDNALTMTTLGTQKLVGAEISAYDPATKKLFVTSGSGLQIVDISNPSAPVPTSTLPIASLSAEGGDITSVAVKNGIVAVAIPDLSKTSPGRVVLLDAATGTILKSLAVGALPDMVTFTPDGKMVLVANEGEPLTDLDNGTIDPAGRISIIDLTSGAATATVTPVSFSSFNASAAALKAAGVRIDAGKTVSQALEPEYIAISPDGLKAVITLQENNAFALLDLITKTITSIVPLGSKDHGLLANAADFSDDDTPGASTAGIIDIQPAPGVMGLYMPDAIASFSAGGATYYVTANEGDAYDGFGDTAREDAIRVGNATLDPDLVLSIVNASATDDYVTEADIKNTDNLGRLNVSKFGDTDGDGDLDQLQAFGGRSFSIWNAAGELVFDSGSLIERATAALTPTLFNANDGLTTQFDNRSDDKAAEPEGVTVGIIGGKTYAFVTLERAGGGVMAFDITDPANVKFTQYARTAGDVSAEGVLFIPAVDSPTGQSIVVVSNELSATVSLYAVEEPAFTLQLLHYYGESGLLGVDTAPIMGAMIDRFDDQYANTLVLGEGDSFIPGPWLVAGADPSLSAVAGIGNTALGRPDIAIMNAFGTDASALGNHEFDLGSPVLQAAIAPAGSGATAWAGAQFPLITSNLTFAADSSLRGIADATLGGSAGNAFAGQEASAIKAKIAPYAVVTQGGEKIGIVGSTTFDLLSKSSPNGTRPLDDNDPNTSDLQEVANYLQNAVNALRATGVNKIIMVDQLDDLQRNKDLAPLVSGIDVMVAGGGHELLKDATDTLGSYPGHVDPAPESYPIVTAGLDGKPVLIVTTDTEYSYLGRLVVQFNSAGEIDTSKLDPAINGAYSSDVATLQAVYGTTDSAAAIIGSSTIASKVQAIVTAIDTIVKDKDGTIFGYTNVYLEGDRVFGRVQEVNLGDISADANREAAIEALPSQPFMVSLKNGGGIRASIGSIAEDGSKIPPIASSVKPAGAISLLDIENALRFDNKLMVFDTTPAGLLAIFNFAAGLSSGPTAQNGGYPQVGGIRFSYNTTNPAASRVENLALIDENDNVIARIVENGVIVPDAPATISVVTLNFTANGGDSYPIRANGENFRYLLTDGTLSAAVSEALNFTEAAAFTSVGQTASTILGEQKAFQDFLLANHPTPETAYNVADTPVTGDTRIEILSQGATDRVLDGITATGTGNDETIEGTAGDDTQIGLDGNDVLVSSRGNDTMDGGLGSADTADFSGSAFGVNVNLAADQATTIIGKPPGFITKQAAMLEGENGYTVTPLITIGDTITGTTGALNSKSAGNYQPTGILDGIGAYSKDASTVRVFVNSELAATVGSSYQLENGTTLKGARVHYFDIDKTTKTVVDAGLAYGELYDRAGNVVVSASQLDGGALNRFCSGSLYEANLFGAGNGLADRIYFAGEETSNRSMWALDTATGDFWAVPEMGRGGWENVAQVNTGTTGQVAFLLGDDGPNGMPLYLYVGQKNAAGDFLDRNGLKTGQLYVWKADAAGVNSPAEFATGTQAGSWVAINARDVSKAGTTGYDALGYKDEATLRSEADAKGAFSFSRPEDLSTNPLNGTQVAFASTGASIAAANTADGVADATDIWGTVYTVNLDFSNIAAPKGSITVLANGNTDASRALRSPDNLDWADDGFIYVNEDRSTTWTGTPNTNEASIVKINPTTGAIARVAEIDRGAVPFGQTDGTPNDFGNWESSGILDVSTLFGEKGGSLFLTDVQAHSINLGSTALAEGGQLALVAAPGVTASASVEIDTLTGIESVIGSAHDDQIIGSSGNNVIDGGLGNDSMAGGAGNDTFHVDSVGDIVNEVAGGGTDTVISSVNFALSAGNSIEAVAAAASVGNAAIDFTGNDLGQDLIGSAGANQLIANGGADGLYGFDGADQLYGGAGSDYLSGGAGADYLSGNADNDVLIGGAGTDILVGGAGDDEYYTSDTSDLIVEYAGEGRDRIYTDVSYALSAGSEVETLSTTSNVGTSNVYLSGNGIANLIIGNNGSNIIDGGAGNDVLYGLGGTDYFAFSTTLNSSTNVDEIVDFSTVDDVVFLDDAVFSGLGSGFLAASAFRSAAGAQAATTDSQRVIYDTTTGNLWFDVDGAGGQASVQFAKIGDHSAVFNYDFYVY